MKRAYQLLFGVWMIGLLVLAGCSSVNPPAATVTAASNAGQTQQRTTNRQPTATDGGQTQQRTANLQPTATTVPPTVTPNVVKATQVPTATSTTGVRPVGSLPIPDKSQPVAFASNASSTVINVDLAENQPVAYQFTVTAGQTAYLAVAGSTNLQVFDANKAPVSQNVKMPGYLGLTLPQAGNFTIVLQGRANHVTLSLYLPPAGSNLASAAPLPEKPQAVTIPALPYTVNFPSRLESGLPQAYTFPAQAGQVLSLAVTGTLTATVIAPDGNSLLADTDAIDTPWIFMLPETGSYTLVLLGSGVVNVNARLTPAPGGTPLAAPQAGGSSPILIAPGQKMAALRTSFIANKPQTYVIHLPANEILFVNATGNAQVTQITGPDQKPLALNHAEYSQRWSATITAAGDYTVTLSGSGISILTFSVPVSIP